MIINYLFTEPFFFLIWLLAIFVGITIHEFAHALVANLSGDPTAKNMGRLTLNPLAHIDLMGLLLLLLAGFGYGKPVPINPYNFRNQKWGTIFVSVAGPLSNLLQIAVFGLALKYLSFLGPTNFLVNFLFSLVYVNIILMVFNILPIPPLDGSKIFLKLLPGSLDSFKLKLEQFGPVILLLLIIFDRLFNLNIFATIFTYISSLIFSLF
ncbi:MAG: site-2 protease family protein [Patescibacteria group bacterium]